LAADHLKERQSARGCLTWPIDTFGVSFWKRFFDQDQDQERAAAPPSAGGWRIAGFDVFVA